MFTYEKESVKTFFQKQPHETNAAATMTHQSRTDKETEEGKLA